MHINGIKHKRRKKKKQCARGGTDERKGEGEG